MIRKIKNILKSNDNLVETPLPPPLYQYDMVSTADSLSSSSCKSNNNNNNSQADNSRNSSPKINFIKRSKCNLFIFCF